MDSDYQKKNAAFTGLFKKFHNERFKTVLYCFLCKINKFTPDF